MSSPPIIINSNPHLDFSQLNNSLLLHTANSSCQNTLSSSSTTPKLFQPVIRQNEQPRKSLISHYLPSSSPARVTPIAGAFVEYTVGHLQVFNQQPRPSSFTTSPRTEICHSDDSKRHTIGCFGNSSPINALFNIICKENGINGTSVVSVEENMNNVGRSRAKQQIPKKGHEENSNESKQNGTSDKVPSKMSSIRVKTPSQTVPAVRKGTSSKEKETPSQDNMR